MTIIKQKIKDMKKITLLLVILLSFFTHSTIISQSSDIELRFHPELDKFDLKKYALPVIDYKSLDMNFILNSTSNTWDIRSKEDYKDLTFMFFINNKIFKNSPRLQMKGNNTIQLGVAWENYRNKDNNKKINDTGLNISYNINDNFKFYNGSKRFFEIDVKSDLSINNGDQFGYYLNHRIFNGTFWGTTIGLGMGYGRLEDVTDAWTTIRMLKEFSRINRLKKVPDDIDIVSIAETVSKIKNARFFDSRIKRIEKLKAIDKIMQEKGLITNDDISYFTTMSDVFEYSRFLHPRRFAGKIIALDLRPHYSLIDGESILSHQNYYSYGLGIEFRDQYYIPLNIFKQIDFGYSINLDYSKISAINNKSKNNSLLSIIPQVFVNYSYYITSRSTYYSNFDFALFQLLKSKIEIDTDSPTYTMAWTNKFSYYISPRARFDINLLLLYNNVQYRYNGFYLQRYEWGGVRLLTPFISKGFNYDLSMRFKYAIF